MFCPQINADYNYEVHRLTQIMNIMRNGVDLGIMTTRITLIKILANYTKRRCSRFEVQGSRFDVQGLKF